MADEKTTFEIALKDSISPQLKQIAGELKELRMSVAAGSADTAKGGSETVTKLQRGMVGLGNVTRETVREVAGIGGFLVGLGKGLVGAYGSVEGIKSIASALQGMAAHRVQLSMYAQDTRIAAQDIEQMRAAMARMGIDAKTSDGYITTLAAKLQDLVAMKQGSPMFSELAKLGPKGAALADELMHTTNYMDAIKRIIEVFKRQGPETQFLMAQVFGVPVSLLDKLKENLDKIGKIYVIDPTVAQAFIDNTTALIEKFDSEWKRFGEHAMDQINPFMDWLNDEMEESDAISATFNTFFDAIADILKQDYADAQALYALYQKLVHDLKPDEVKKALQDAVDKATGQTPRTSEEQQRLELENSKFLGEIRDTIKRMENSLFGGEDVEGSGLGGGTTAGSGAGVAGTGFPGDTAGPAVDVPSEPSTEADVAGTGPSGGRFNVPSGTALTGEKETVRLANGQLITVNKKVSAQFSGFFNELIKKGAPVKSLGGFGFRPGNPSQHPIGFAVDWAQHARNIVDPDVQRWIDTHRSELSEAEKRWGVSGGENWRSPDTGHFSIEKMMGRKSLGELRGDAGQRDDDRESIDRGQQQSVWDKKGDAIKFTFNNVPSGVKTNAEAAGSFTDVTVSRKSAIEERTD